MTPFADEPAWLVCAFHRFNSEYEENGLVRATEAVLPGRGRCSRLIEPRL